MKNNPLFYLFPALIAVLSLYYVSYKQGEKEGIKQAYKERIEIFTFGNPSEFNDFDTEIAANFLKKTKERIFEKTNKKLNIEDLLSLFHSCEAKVFWTGKETQILLNLSKN